MRRTFWGGLLVSGLLAIAGVTVSAQSSPFAAQIQAALRALGWVQSTATYTQWSKNFLFATGGYLNFGLNSGDSGYGIRDLAGVMQYKDAAGTWTSLPTGGAAPVDATYITQTPNATLTNEQALSGLGSALLVNATGTGVLTAYAGGTCTNQFMTALSALGVVTCTATLPTFTATSGFVAGPTVGTEIITNGSCATDTSGWTGANWSSSAGACLHAAGSTVAFSQAGAVSVVGTLYKVTFTVTGRSAGSVRYTTGGSVGPLVSTNTTATAYFVALTTANFTIVPASSFDGSVSAISFKAVTGSYTGSGPVAIGPVPYTPDALLEISDNVTQLPVPGISDVQLHVAAADGRLTVALLDNFFSGNILRGRIAGGTAAAPSALGTGALMMAMGTTGYGATGYATGDRAAIQMSAAEAWTDTAQGTYLSFLTTAKTTTLLTEKMRLFDDGGLSLSSNPTVDPGANTINADGGYKINGTAGATHATCSVITSITVVGGLVTAITCS